MPLQFLSPIHKASRQISIYLERATMELRVSPGEGHLLSYLSTYAPCPVSELERVFGHKRSTLTSMLDRLSDRGLLNRQINPDDRRSFTIALTPAGRKLAGKLKRNRHYVQIAKAAILKRPSLPDFQRFPLPDFECFSTPPLQAPSTP